MTRRRLISGLLLVLLACFAALLGWRAGDRARTGDDALDRPHASDVSVRSTRPVPSALTVDDDLIAAAEPGQEQERQDRLDDLERFAESAGFNVVCTLEPALEAASATLLPDGWRGDGEGIPVMVLNGRLFLMVPEAIASGTAVLRVDGHLPARIAWSGAAGGEGSCTPEPVRLDPSGPAVVVGVVRNAEGEREGAVWVEGCGGRALTDEEGGYYLEALPEPCELVAYRQDGMFTARSEPVPVDPKPDEERIADIALPPFRTAGLGIMIGQNEDGIEVLRTYDGGSAAEAGLAEGDVILSIDGASTTGFTLEDFIGSALGEAGTEVELVVRTAEGERTITLDRREMSSPRRR